MADFGLDDALDGFLEGNKKPARRRVPPAGYCVGSSSRYGMKTAIVKAAAKSAIAAMKRLIPVIISFFIRPPFFSLQAYLFLIFEGKKYIGNCQEFFTNIPYIFYGFTWNPVDPGSIVAGLKVLNSLARPQKAQRFVGRQ